MIERCAARKSEVVARDTGALVDRVVGVVRHAAVHLEQQRTRDRPRHNGAIQSDQSGIVGPGLEHRARSAHATRFQVHDQADALHERVPLGEQHGAAQPRLLGVREKEHNVVQQWLPAGQQVGDLEHDRDADPVVGRGGRTRHAIVMRGDHHGRARTRPASNSDDVAHDAATRRERRALQSFLQLRLVPVLAQLRDDSLADDPLRNAAGRVRQVLADQVLQVAECAFRRERRAIRRRYDRHRRMLEAVQDHEVEGQYTDEQRRQQPASPHHGDAPVRTTRSAATTRAAWWTSRIARLSGTIATTSALLISSVSVIRCECRSMKPGV